MKSWCWPAALLLALLPTLLVGGVASAQGPTISNVESGNITATSAVITWTTDEPADSRVLYGNTTLLTSAALDSALVVNHAVTLGNLTPSTLYYYEVRSTNAGGNTTIDDNGGSLYTFTTLEHIDLEGWAWYSYVGYLVDVTLSADVAMMERSHAANSYSLHVAGNLTLILPNAPDLTIPLDMYGSRVRSLFYLRQETAGKSATFTGSWIDAGNGTYYVGTSGAVALPNPDGGVFKTARICFIALQTPNVDVPVTSPGGSIADNVESMVTAFADLMDNFMDWLLGTTFKNTVSKVLFQLTTLVAAFRDAITPYIT